MDTGKPPAETPDWAQKTLKALRWAGWVVAVVAVVVTAVATYQRTGEVVIPPLPPVPQQGTYEIDEAGQVYASGWVDDAEARAESLARFPAVAFAGTPAGRAVMGAERDSFLWRHVRTAAGKRETDTWYPNVNQQDVGCCVGCGWKHCVDVLAGVQIKLGNRLEEWRPVSAEAIYGMSRVEYGKARLNGDGSVGAWAREAVDRGGVAEMKKYRSADLTTFSPARARQFGATGVPDDIETAAKSQTVRGTALVRTWEELSKAIQQGYPVAVCSNVGFNAPNGQIGGRDANGFIAARGTWNHCMAFVGIRHGQRPGVFCLNSWGDTVHRGPLWPADAPPAGFWVDARTAERMVAQGDSYALSDLAGFPARPLEWEVRRSTPKLRPVPLAELLALAP